MKFVLVLVLLAAVGLAKAQTETHAEKYGMATIRVVDIEVSEFQAIEREFRESVSWHSSRHCKDGKDNCETEDKQIRYQDVVVQNIDSSVEDVQVRFYIRDRYDKDMAALLGDQLRNVFSDYGGEIEGDLDVDDIDWLSPLDEGMEGWLIAVIVISCVVGVALIITIAVLGSKHHKEKKRRADMTSQHILHAKYDSVILADGKDNPGYDSDREAEHKPSTSSSERLSVVREPPPYSTNVAGHDLHHYDKMEYNTKI